MRRVFSILLVAMICCGFVPQHKVSRQRYEQKTISELYAEAIKQATIHRDTLHAVVAIEAILKKDSNYAPALNLLSRLTIDPKNAVEYSERAYSQDTTNRYFLEDYGGALIRANEYDRAIGVFEKIVSKSTEPDHYRIFALLLDSKKRTAEALGVLDTAEVRFGRIPQLGRIRQYFLLKMGKTLAAEADARRAVEEAPYLAENHISLADIYAIMGRDSLALAEYRAAIKVDTTAIESWAALGNFFQKRGDLGKYLSILENIFRSEKFPLKEKIEEWKTLSSDISSYRKYYSQYDALIKLLYIHYPVSKEVALLYIQHQIKSGNIENALSLCKQIIDYKNPKTEDFTRVIDIENYLNRPDSALFYTNLALKYFPRNGELLIARGSFAYNKKDYDGALEHFNEALKYADNDTLRSRLWGSIGDVEYNRERSKQSYKAYEKALKFYGENAIVLNNYAYYLSIEEHDLERALTMANRANELSANNATYLDTKAWVLYKLGRYSEAKKVMQQALSLDRSNSPEFSLHYGDILHALGDEFMAKTYWRKALERGADTKEIEKRFLKETNPKKE